MGTAKYIKIKHALKEEILSNKFTSGDKFYSEKELVEKFQVSSITVIRAVKELASEGFLVRIQGKGTYISKARKQKLITFSDIELFDINHEQVQVLSINKGNNPHILKELELTSDANYFRIERIRLFNDSPYFYQKSYIPEKFIVNTRDLNYYESIYQRFKTDFSINMSDQFFNETNQIVFPSDDYIASKLDISTNIPTVKQIKKTREWQSNDILEYTISHKKWDYYMIEFQTFKSPQ